MHTLGERIESIPPYGLMILVALLLAFCFIILAARRLNLDAENLIYYFVISGVGALVLAKLLYILVSLNDIVEAAKIMDLPELILRYSRGGFVFYGGLLGALLVFSIIKRRENLDAETVYPVMVPALAIFAGISRIGCLLTGCCYGARTDSAFSIIYHHSQIAPCDVPLIPVQLYEAVFQILLAITLILITKYFAKTRRHLLTIYLASYATFRFILEFYRGDLSRGIYLGLSTSQWISIIIIFILIFKSLFQLSKRRT